MHYSTIAAFSLVALAAAAPTDVTAESEISARNNGDSLIARGVTMTMHGIQNPTPETENAGQDTTQARDLEKRGDSTSCGSRKIYIPVADPSATQYGFNTAVQTFCNEAANWQIPVGKDLSATVGGLVTTKPNLNKGNPGHVDFTIHNKKFSPDGSVSYNDCVNYFSYVSSTSSSCYGKKNKDTRGGKRTSSAFGWFNAECKNGAA